MDPTDFFLASPNLSCDRFFHYFILMLILSLMFINVVNIYCFWYRAFYTLDIESKIISLTNLIGYT